MTARRTASRLAPWVVLLWPLGACTTEMPPGNEDGGAVDAGPEGGAPDGAAPDGGRSADGGTRDGGEVTDAALPPGDAGDAGDAGDRAPRRFAPNVAFDYQLGGAYPPPAGVELLVRDRKDRTAPGRYNVCYVNGFQTQPDERDFWTSEHPDLVLRDEGGQPVVDPDWGEWLLDVTTADKRRRRPPSWATGSPAAQPTAATRPSIATAATTSAAPGPASAPWRTAAGPPTWPAFGPIERPRHGRRRGNAPRPSATRTESTSPDWC